MLGPIIALCLAQVPWARFPNEKSSIPLVRAIVELRLDEARQLIASGADVNAVEQITPLYAAQEYISSSRQRHAMIKTLLRAGAMADQPTRDGTTTLMLAAYHGDVRAAELLLDSGADPLRRNEQGYTAIDSARRHGHDE